MKEKSRGRTCKRAMRICCSPSIFPRAPIDSVKIEMGLWALRMSLSLKNSAESRNVFVISKSVSSLAVRSGGRPKE